MYVVLHTQLCVVCVLVCELFVQVSIDPILAGGADIDLIELRTLKPLDLETIGLSLRRTHKVSRPPAPLSRLKLTPVIGRCLK